MAKIEYIPPTKMRRFEEVISKSESKEQLHSEEVTETDKSRESKNDHVSDTESVIFHRKSEEQMNLLRERAKEIPLFSHCDGEQMNVLFDAMFERKTEKGEIIIQQGDKGDSFYIIETGTYDVLKSDGDNEKCIATYVDQGHFGEMSLVYDCPRSATVKSMTRGVLWGLDRKTFHRIVVKATAQRREEFDKLSLSISMLESLSNYERMNLTDVLSKVTFHKDERIVNEGEEATNMFFVMEGEVSVRVKDKHNGVEREVAKLKRGQFFGEYALVYGKPRTASVVAMSDDTKCAVLELFSFERLLGPCVDVMKKNIEKYEFEDERVL